MGMLMKPQEGCVAMNKIPIVMNFFMILCQLTTHVMAFCFCLLQVVKRSASLC